MVFSENEIGSLDWELLGHSLAWNYHNQDVLDRHVGELSRKRYEVWDFDCSSSSREAPAVEIASAFGVQSDFSGNPDGLDDYLYDEGRLSDHTP